jgi:hypothetical protein
VEMLNKREPKVEAVAVEQKEDAPVLDPTMISPTSDTQNNLSGPSILLTDEGYPGQQSMSPLSSVPSIPIPIADSSSSETCESPVIYGFFPATTRHIREEHRASVDNKSAREERYESKTSSDARGDGSVELTKSSEANCVGPNEKSGKCVCRTIVMFT